MSVGSSTPRPPRMAASPVVGLSSYSALGLGTDADPTGRPCRGRLQHQSRSQMTHSMPAGFGIDHSNWSTSFIDIPTTVGSADCSTRAQPTQPAAHSPRNPARTQGALTQPAPRTTFSRYQRCSFRIVPYYNQPLDIPNLWRNPLGKIETCNIQDLQSLQVTQLRRNTP